MSLSELSPADRHRAIATRFTEVVEGVSDWSAPTPVAEWQASDVVEHLTGWLPGMLAGGSTLTIEMPADADLPTQWAALRDGVQAILDDPELAATTHRGEHTGEQRADELIDRFYTADVFMHTWDLARASGQDDTLEAAFVSQLFDGMSGMVEVIRGSGQFGDQQPVADDAPVQDRFLAFIGRNPQWTRSG